MTQETFKKYPNDLFEAKCVSNNTMKLDLDHNIKAVYLYMLLRYEFFNKSGGIFFENQDDIAVKCGLSRRSVIRYVAKLTEIGLLTIGKKRLGSGALSNNYVINKVDGVQWWYDDKKVKKEPAYQNSRIVPNLDIDDCPF